MTKSKHTPNTAKTRELAQDWQNLKNRWNNTGDFVLRANVAPTKTNEAGADTGLTSSSGQRAINERIAANHAILSRVTSGGTVALHTSPKYTGNNVLGIATMHKSNLVPVFSTDEAIEVANMRRG